MAIGNNSITDFEIFLNGYPVKKVTSTTLVPRKKFQWVRNIIHTRKYNHSGTLYFEINNKEKKVRWDKSLQN